MGELLPKGCEVREDREGLQPPTLGDELLALYQDSCFRVIDDRTGEASPCATIGEFVADKVAGVERSEITEQSAINTGTSHARIIGRRCQGLGPDGACGLDAAGLLLALQQDTQPV